MVIFLSAGMAREVQEKLLEGGYAPDTPAAIVYKASWKDEKKVLCTVGTLSEAAAGSGITKTALIIVGGVLSHADYSRSRLYDPGFTTGWRKAEGAE